MPQVAAVKTSYTPSVVAGAMIWAYQQVTGKAPPATTSWLYPLAQSAIETAAWAGCYNNNAGNVTTANPNTDPWMYEPGNALQFRSYNTIGDGCVSMIKWLSSHGTLAYADSGDVSGYLSSLQAGCYAGCGVAYPDISGYVSKYQNISPTPYLNLQTWQVVAIASGILLGCGCIAYYIAEGELPTPKRLAQTL
jgi:hypothetical protein